jgi:uncharacterized membrane protein YdfJ with MMPL/SSD domain
MLGTSGKIVLVSGMTLLVCFAMMIVLPVSLVQSLGVGAAVTVFMAVSAALSLTPSVLLSCPAFFSSNKNWGFSTDGCCCSTTDPADPLIEKLYAEATAETDLSESCWNTFARMMHRAWPIVFLVLLGTAIPVGLLTIPKLGYACGLLPLMPRDADATHTLKDLQAAFGAGAVFPTSFVIVPPANSTVAADNRSAWLKQSCDALTEMASQIDVQGAPPFTAAAFTGLMILNGSCTTPDAPGPGKWSAGFKATQVMISYKIDPFTTQGQDWLNQLRNVSGNQTEQATGTYYIVSEGANQMDAVQSVFNHFALMIGLMMGAVLLVIGISFKSFVAPIRAVVCLLFMLAITMGLSIWTFQDGLLDFLSWPQLAKRDSGAMSWFSPSIALSVLIGLGLDYDIFYTEKVAEEREHGYSEKEASKRALAATANLISAAGLIMVTAFLSVLHDLFFLGVVMVVAFLSVLRGLFFRA